MRALFAPPLRVEELSGDDIRLLQIAFSSGDTQEQAWVQWRSAVDFDTLTTGCLLVPAAYHSLPDPNAGRVTERMRGSFRKNWLLTQLLEKSVAPLFEKIGASGIDCVLGDDLALALAYYPNPGMRPIYEVTLYCSHADRSKLIDLIEETEFPPARGESWRLNDQALLRLRNIRPSSHTACPPEEMTIGMPVLNPTEQFWSTFQAARPQPLMRFLDLAYVYRDHGARIDWSVISERAKPAGFQATLHDVVTFFTEILGLELSPEANAVIAQKGKRATSGVLKQHARNLAWNIRKRVQA